MSRRRRVAGLDAVRGLAIGLVLARHAFPASLGAAGIVGVALFFVLSGYLITGVLLRDVAATGRVDYRKFYLNRAARLLPALMFFLAFFGVTGLFIYPPGERSIIVSTVLAGAFYAANVPGVHLAGGMTHLWTLAVEEQFYLVWPAVLLMALRANRAPQLLIGGTLFWLVSTLALLRTAGGDAAFLYELPTTWLLALLAGAALQLVDSVRTSLRTWWALPALGVLLGVCWSPEAKDHAATYFVLGPVVAVCGSVLVGVAARTPAVPQTLAPLVWLGTISYAAYLWNYLLVSWLAWSLPERWWSSLLATAATLAVAAFSWFCIERPVLAVRARRSSPERLSTHR